MRIDILMGLPGLKFDEAWKEKTTSKYGKTPIHILGVTDLLKVKSRTGRPQDHSVIYTRGRISIRYYLLEDLDVLINGAGAATPPEAVLQRLLLGSPYGSRTRVSWLRTMHPRPLDEGAMSDQNGGCLYHNRTNIQTKKIIYLFWARTDRISASFRSRDQLLISHSRRAAVTLVRFLSA